MGTEDEYLVYIDKNETRFYYKNKKLHREAGPAIVPLEDKELYTNLSDEELYIKTYTPIIPEKEPEKLQEPKTVYYDCGIITFESPIEYHYEVISSYYLEGVCYTEKEFNSIILKKAMEKELLNEKQNKKKVKI